MKQHNLIGGIVFLTIAVAVLFEASKLPFGSFKAPKTGFVPLILAILLAIFSLILLSQAIREKDWKGSLIGMRLGSWKRIFLTLGTLFAFAFFFEPLGYLIATFLLVGVLSRAFWPQRWWVVILLAFSSTLVSFLIFGLLLDSPLPAGLLQYVLKRG